MNQKTLLLLGVVVLVLGGIFALTEPNYQRVEDARISKPFAQLDGAQITKIHIDQGANSLDLESKDGKWTVPTRGGYPSDPNKVRSLLVHVADMTVSQKVTESPDDFDKLGVSDKAVKDGRSKVVLFGTDGKPVAGIYLGDYRKGKDANPFGGAGGSKGQYIRADGSNSVYMTLESPVAPATATSWLDTNISNVMQSNIENIRQYKLNAGAENLEIELKRQPDYTGGTSLKYQGQVEEGKEVKDSSLNMLRTALENLRFEDVLKADDEKVKDAVPEFRTEFQTTGALVYSVSSFKKDDKIYARVGVRFDDQLKSAVEARVLANRKELEARKQAVAETLAKEKADSKADTEEVTPKKSPAEQAADELPMPVFATPEDAKAVNDQYAGWVYQIPTYNGTKFTLTKDSFVQPKAAPGSESPSAEAPAGE